MRYALLVHLPHRNCCKSNTTETEIRQVSFAGVLLFFKVINPWADVHH